MKLPSRVVFASKDAERAFVHLSDDDPLKGHIRRAVALLRENAFAGVQIPKRLIPRVYIKKYAVVNLWKYDLPRGWRLISAVLEWFPHHEYERRFKY